MTKERLVTVLREYNALLERDSHGSERMSNAPGVRRFRHLRWMCAEACAYAETDTEKAMRWLGFVQGAFWALGYRTIEQMRVDNKSFTMSETETDTLDPTGVRRWLASKEIMSGVDPPLRYDLSGRRMTRCQSDDDGHCEFKECPQLRDGEPNKSGRHCPLDKRGDEES